MKEKDFRNVLLFMCNHWTQEECSHIFNECDLSADNWEYSLGQHIWYKWGEACEYHHGSLDGITSFILGLDEKCLQKLIDRTIKYYNK